MNEPDFAALNYSARDLDRRATCRGFTLVEAIVVMAVAAILVVVAVPGMTSVYLDNRRTSSVNKFFTGFQVARSEAISRNQRIVVCPSKSGEACGGDWGDGIIVFADLDQDQTLDAAEPTLYTAGPMNNLNITSTAFPAFLIYRPNGRVMVTSVRDNSGSFEICDYRGSDHARVLSIDTTGRPRVAHNHEGEVPATC